MFQNCDDNFNKNPYTHVNLAKTGDIIQVKEKFRT